MKVTQTEVDQMLEDKKSKPLTLKTYLDESEKTELRLLESIWSLERQISELSQKLSAPKLDNAIEAIRENETNLVLSADGQRLRVIVDGKLIVDFHTNYVLRALAGLTGKRGQK